MGDKSGGSDTGPMLEYGDKALKLQKEQYDYSKKISQPWLNTGTGAINQLSTLMGLSGGGNETRQSIYDKLAPQYTTSAVNATPSTMNNLYVGSNGQVFDATNSKALTNYLDSIDTYGSPDKYNVRKANNIIRKNDYSSYGLKPVQTTSTSPKVDTAALNAAVDAAYTNQKPNDNFGKLLETYSGQDIYNDPSYAFRVGQGTKAMERQLAASGKYLTPAASLALQEYGQNMGSQEYGNAYNRFNQDQGNLYNRLAGLAGMGQTQSGQVIGAGSNYANAGSDIYTGMGNAITSANQAKAANQGSMFNTLLGTAGKIGAAYFTGGSSLAATGI